jgi:hypothetical protein
MRSSGFILIDNPPSHGYDHGAPARTEQGKAVKTKGKRPLRVLVLAVLVIILYFALFPYPVGRELVVRPVWASAIPAALPAAGEATAGLAAAPFQLGDLFGYVDTDGALLSAGRTPFQVALSARGFVTYTRLGSTWIFQDPRGRRQFTFSGSGYPLLSPDGTRLFTVKTDASGLTELDRNGDPLWTRDFPSLMTCLSVAGENAMAVGLLSGELTVVDRQGRILASALPAGSRIPVILGCAVSADGLRVAAVSGIDPQLLLVEERQGTAYKPLARITLPSEFRREVRMGFDPAGSWLYFENERGVGLWSADTGRASLLPLAGGAAEGVFLPTHRAVAFVSGAEARREIIIVTPPASLRSREAFTGAAVFAGTIGDGLLLGVDGLLLRIDLEAL